ncbi:MAG: hypothetical protein JWM36_3015 [Hyphomicrobiales bacterium]|nr:hypothetical protein [Hyphomicrobiales bacterium]
MIGRAFPGRMPDRIMGKLTSMFRRRTCALPRAFWAGCCPILAHLRGHIIRAHVYAHLLPAMVPKAVAHVALTAKRRVEKNAACN